MIDLHSHLLPNLDDGSRSAAQSFEVLERFAGIGVDQVVLTPHVTASEIGADSDDPVERRQVSFEDLERRAPKAPKLHLGFEIMLDQPLEDATLQDRRYSLAESRYYLVEFPLGVAAEYATRVLKRISDTGAVPIIAHPERYRSCSPDVVTAWRAVGARIQVDATTVTRPNSRGERARDLLAHGLADVLAADNHGDGRNLGSAREFFEDRDLGAVADRLLAGNPRAVVEDRALQPVESVVLRRGALDLIKRFLK